MVYSSALFAGLALAAGAVGGATDCPDTPGAGPHYALYFDQWHTTSLPNKTMTAGITHVITAFANSSLFTTEPAGVYTPFMNLTDIRAMFDNGTKVCMAIGGWGDTEGFRVGMASDRSRELYAKNVARTIDRLGYDCVDFDLEYPAGNGYDYKQVPNSKLTSEIKAYPKLLAAVKDAIGDREISLAVPGLLRDMIGFTNESVPRIDAAVDWVNIMTYDLMNRRDTVTKHHTDIKGSLAAIDAYISRGMTPSKMSLGFSFYAKYFQLAANSTCVGPLGCPIALAEDAEGQDTGTSGAMTFENSSYPVAVDPSTLTPSTSGACGTGTVFECTGPATQGACCSQYGFCGDTDGHCGTGCQSQFGSCTASGKTTAQSFVSAMTNGTTDVENGGQWYIDTEANMFWTWDTPELMTKKFTDIVKARGLGGVMAWSLGEDSYDWSHLKAIQDGVNALKASPSVKTTQKKTQKKQKNRGDRNRD
ncbi:unnamed protein product [Discula destructiva]